MPISEDASRSSRQRRRDNMPRGIEFLFSRNRLNVAISRAHCLAVIFANPRLLEAACTTVEQLRLVDALCWAKLYAEA